MIIENIRKYLENKGINISQAERDVGVSNGTFQKAFNGKSIKTDTLEKFLNTYNDINPHWLLTGEGNMLKSEGTVLEKEQLDCSSFKNIIERQEKMINSLMEQNKQLLRMVDIQTNLVRSRKKRQD